MKRYYSPDDSTYFKDIEVIDVYASKKHLLSIKDPENFNRAKLRDHLKTTCGAKAFSIHFKLKDSSETQCMQLNCSNWGRSRKNKPATEKETQTVMTNNTSIETLLLALLQQQSDTNKALLEIAKGLQGGSGVIEIYKELSETRIKDMKEVIKELKSGGNNSGSDDLMTQLAPLLLAKLTGGGVPQ